MSRINFDLFSVCFSFRPSIFQKQVSQFSGAVYFLPKITNNTQYSCPIFVSFIDDSYMQYRRRLNRRMLERSKPCKSRFYVSLNFSYVFDSFCPTIQSFSESLKVFLSTEKTPYFFFHESTQPNSKCKKRKNDFWIAFSHLKIQSSIFKMNSVLEDCFFF